jgi:hypothetical protein
MRALRALAITALCAAALAALMPGETRAACEGAWCPRSPGTMVDDTFGFFRTLVPPKSSEAKQDSPTGRSDAPSFFSGAKPDAQTARREPRSGRPQAAAPSREPLTAEDEVLPAPKVKKRSQKRTRQAAKTSKRPAAIPPPAAGRSPAAAPDAALQAQANVDRFTMLAMWRAAQMQDTTAGSEEVGTVVGAPAPDETGRGSRLASGASAKGPATEPAPPPDTRASAYLKSTADQWASAQLSAAATADPRGGLGAPPDRLADDAANPRLPVVVTSVTVANANEVNEIDLAAADLPPEPSQFWLHVLFAMLGGSLATGAAARLWFV